ncbi:MAG: matrixin family metalloprotease [Acidobacteria bacterium]|nr:matrixin family metalloprotease [Acidobacteriota bacterium]
MTCRAAAFLAGILALALTADLEAYLKLGYPLGDRVIALRWSDMPVRYYVTGRGVAGVTAAALEERVAAGFATWGAGSNVVVSGQFGGFVAAEPDVDDGLTVVGFRTRDDLDHVLGATSFTVDDMSGRLVEADIFLNSRFPWSVSSGGESGRYDVQSIATHEIGHLLGLSHSALGETTVAGGGRTVQAKAAVMFPIAYPSGNIRDRALTPDDEAAIADVYGTLDARRTLGSITGRVTANGAGVFGAHVVAFSPATGVSIGGFTLSRDGQYVIGGLPSGFYIVRAEPLDDADLDSFFDDSAPVTLGFSPAYAATLVGVPEGGAASAPDIKVTPK